MNNDSEAENKKVKEAKEAAGAEENFENEDEAVENSLEGSGIEERSSSENEMPPFAFLPKPKDSYYGGKLEEAENGPLRTDSEEKRRMLAREKWLNVTGRKPQSIPNVKKCLKDEEESTRIIFFGDRRPAQIEKERKQKWIQMITDEAYKKTGVNYGVLLKEIGIPYWMDSLWVVQYHPSGEKIAGGFRNGGVQVRNSLTGEIIFNLKTLESNDNLPVRGIRYYPNDPSKMYVAGGAGYVQIFDGETGANLFNGSYIKHVNSIDFNLDGTILATGGRGGEVCTLDAASLKVTSMRVRPEINESTQYNIDEEFHRLRIQAVKFHHTEPNIFLTGGWDKCVKIWDVRVPGAVRSINGPYLCGEGLDLNGNTILTASWVSENSLQLWDFLSGNLISNVPVETKKTRFDGEFLYTAQFYKDKKEYPSNPRLVVLGGSGFNEVNLIKISNGKILASFPAYKTVICLDTWGPYVAYGGKESLVRLGQIYLPQKF